MSRRAHVALADGRQLDFEIYPSATARSLRLKMTARGVLTVIAPKGVDDGRVVELVDGKRDWIAAKLNHFADVRHLLHSNEVARPEAFDLPALAESWRVEYVTTKGKSVAARTDRQGRVLVAGALGDERNCTAALRRWLARRAKETLAPRLEALAAENGLHFGHLTIKNQRTRWGSCSVDNAISLNAKLLFLPPNLVRYVLMHELCHTMERNHTSRFWTLLRQFEPQTDLLHGQMRDAWKLVAPWAHPVRTGGDYL